MMRKRIAVVPLVVLLAFAPVVACHLGGGDMPDSQMQRMRTDGRSPTEVDPTLRVGLPPMDGGANPAADTMNMDAGNDMGMGAMPTQGGAGQPNAARTGGPMAMGKDAGMKMDGGMPMDGGCCGRGGMPMPPGSAMPVPRPMPPHPMPMPSRGHEGHM